MMNSRFLVPFLLSSWCGLLSAQHQGQTLRSQIDSYVRVNQGAIVREFVQLLSIPNVAADRDNIRRNAALLREMFERRGFRAELLETAGNPLMWAELRVPGARRTLLLYCHYDGQPVNPPEWHQASPFAPILRAGRLEEGARDLGDPSARGAFGPNDRIYARSASDDKAPILAMLAAIDALHSVGRQPSSNLRILLDGEEEAGSPSLVPAIGRYHEKLTADAMVIFDGPVHPSGRPTIAYGARGNLAIQLTVFGPKVALHSGHYGNWVPNPAMRLAELLATMKDENGKVLVEGFYDGIPKLPPEERRMLDAVPDDLDSLQELFGIAAPERPNLTLQEAVQLPSLNVRGLSSGFVGEEARTIIPAQAVAEIDVRLVKETPARRQFERILAHIRKQGWHIVRADPDDRTCARFARIVKVTSRGEGINAFRTSPLLPLSRQLVTAMTDDPAWPFEPQYDGFRACSGGARGVHFRKESRYAGRNFGVGRPGRQAVSPTVGGPQGVRLELGRGGLKFRCARMCARFSTERVRKPQLGLRTPCVLYLESRQLRQTLVPFLGALQSRCSPS